jgi:penicillin-binding protein 2
MTLMALQEGIVEKDETVTCSGGHPLGGGRFFRCMHVHGRIASEEAIQRSCNTYFFEMMLRIGGSSPRDEDAVAKGVNTFQRYAHYFGMGTPIATDIQDQRPGLIADSAYFAEKFGDYWNLSWMNMGIGQGDVENTPLELALMTATIANGGTRHSPHLIKELRHPETGEVVRPSLPAPFEVPIDDVHFETVRNGMRLVMEEGTGRGVQIPGITSGGKTGTAQDGVGRKDNSVFIMFAPYDNPQIAIAVQVENAGYGSTAAAPIASLMAEQYLNGGIAPERRALADRVRAVQSQYIYD